MSVENIIIYNDEQVDNIGFSSEACSHQINSDNFFKVGFCTILVTLAVNANIGNIIDSNCIIKSDVEYININSLYGVETVAVDINETGDLMKIKNLNKIENMALFEEDWNGTGGRKFTTKAISIFKDVIEALEHQPEIAPTGRNSLYMEYEFTDNSVLAFEVAETFTEKVYVPKGDFSLATVERYTQNIIENIVLSVRGIYEQRSN